MECKKFIFFKWWLFRNKSSNIRYLIELIKVIFSVNKDLLKKNNLNLIKNLKSEKDIFKLNNKN